MYRDTSGAERGSGIIIKKDNLYKNSYCAHGHTPTPLCRLSSVYTKIKNHHFVTQLSILSWSWVERGLKLFFLPAVLFHPFPPPPPLQTGRSYLPIPLRIFFNDSYCVQFDRFLIFAHHYHQQFFQPFCCDQEESAKRRQSNNNNTSFWAKDIFGDTLNNEQTHSTDQSIAVQPF